MVADRTLTLRQVMARTGLSRGELEALVAAGDFPRAVPLGPWATGWSQRAVGAWLTARDTGQPA